MLTSASSCLKRHCSSPIITNCENPRSVLRTLISCFLFIITSLLGGILVAIRLGGILVAIRVCSQWSCDFNDLGQKIVKHTDYNMYEFYKACSCSMYYPESVGILLQEMVK